jgi:hypothetical protein
MRTRRPFETVILREKAYRELYEEAFASPAYTKDFTEARHRAEFDALNSGLRESLKKAWEEDYCGNKDFAIMDDKEAFGGWHHCGGIYSTRICCPEYIEAITAVIASLAHASLWTYHTTCETWQDDTPLPVHGEFFVRDGKLYAPKDDNDYARVFGGQS